MFNINYMNIYIEIFVLYILYVCVCVCIMYIHNKYTQYTHIKTKTFILAAINHD